MAKKYNYKRKSVKGTDALVEWLNENGIPPQRVVSVCCDEDWRTVIYRAESKEKDDAGQGVNYGI